MILTTYKVMATMHDDAEGRYHEVVEAEGTYYVREVRRGQGIGGWSAVAISPRGLNPDLDTYLERCAGNFGWRIERAADLECKRRLMGSMAPVYPGPRS